jgi:hypothetical protein
LGLSRPTRVKAATVLLALSALAVVVPEYFKAHVSEHVPPSKITLFGRRFAELRRALPPHGVVGYASDADEGEAVWEFYETQYFLAPALLEKTTGHELVVGNFHHTPVDADWLAGQNLVLLRDYGDGVMLFGRKQE